MAGASVVVGASVEVVGATVVGGIVVAAAVVGTVVGGVVDADDWMKTGEVVVGATVVVVVSVVSLSVDSVSGSPPTPITKTAPTISTGMVASAAMTPVRLAA